jgi:hypothetical protein
MALRAQRFRSAGLGGQRGAPQTGTTYQFSGSEETISKATKARIAATRFQQVMAARGAGGGGQAPRAAQSGGDVSAIRGAQNAERRFEGEQRPFGSGQPQRTWS